MSSKHRTFIEQLFFDYEVTDNQIKKILSVTTDKNLIRYACSMIDNGVSFEVVLKSLKEI